MFEIPFFAKILLHGPYVQKKYFLYGKFSAQRNTSEAENSAIDIRIRSWLAVRQDTEPSSITDIPYHQQNGQHHILTLAKTPSADRSHLSPETCSPKLPLQGWPCTLY